MRYVLILLSLCSVALAGESMPPQQMMPPVEDGISLSEWAELIFAIAALITALGGGGMWIHKKRKQSRR